MRPAAWLTAGLFALPLVAALAFSLEGVFDAAAWADLFGDTQFAPALATSLRVGIASTLASLLLAMLLATALHGTGAWRWLETSLGALLAVPHVAFASGLALLAMPSGLVARLVAPLFGWDAPPDVATVRDAAGLSLTLGLVLKETPFLLWNLVALLRRAGEGGRLARQRDAARAMGYGDAAVWWRLWWPQLLPRLAWPLLAVWAYGVSVVDMAIVLGPTRPPTLGVLAWQWLQDADAAANRRGTAAAVLLAGVVAAGALAAWVLARAVVPALVRRWTDGRRRASGAGGVVAGLLAALVAAVYGLVPAVLLVASVAGLWTFPDLLPQAWNGDAWQAVAGSLHVLADTAGIALVSAAAGVALAVAWMEATPARWDRLAAPFAFAPLLVPGVLVAAGLYRLALATQLDGRWLGVALSHGLFTAPYAWIALAPAYRGFDARIEQTVAALGRGRLALLWQVKWPMLAAPLASAFAVALAVSVAQYLPTQFVGAGRIATVTTEALTLAAGGQRGTMAAFALLQALLPVLAFGAARAVGLRQARRSGEAGAA